MMVDLCRLDFFFSLLLILLILLVLLMLLFDFAWSDFSVLVQGMVFTSGVLCFYGGNIWLVGWRIDG
ncbi:hypothetical protein BZA77DRAFT_328933 [Pyronema omphalodes]|nr:hypothetical protein BZA77DRAFT_328933 [Pyronema omphalodes]